MKTTKAGLISIAASAGTVLTVVFGVGKLLGLVNEAENRIQNNDRDIIAIYRTLDSMKIEQQKINEQQDRIMLRFQDSINTRLIRIEDKIDSYIVKQR